MPYTKSCNTCVLDFKAGEIDDELPNDAPEGLAGPNGFEMAMKRVGRRRSKCRYAASLRPRTDAPSRCCNMTMCHDVAANNRHVGLRAMTHKMIDVHCAQTGSLYKKKILREMLTNSSRLGAAWLVQVPNAAK